MKTFHAHIAAGLAMIAASPAFAQDADAGSPATPASSFSGPFVEASLGWDHLAAKSIKDIDSTAQAQGTSSGLLFGGALGYDFALTDRVTLGGELGLYGSGSRWNNDSNLVTGTFNTASVRTGRDIFAGAKLGYALSPQTRLFAKAGYTNTHFGVTATDGTTTLYNAVDASGFRLGTGLEQKLTKSTYVKFEYDYSHYGSGQFNYAGSTPDSSTFDLHNDRHQLMASIGLRF